MTSRHGSLTVSATSVQEHGEEGARNWRSAPQWRQTVLQNRPALGGSGQITFSCNSQTPTLSPAFTAPGAVLATPTLTNYAAPYNATGLFMYIHNGAVNTGACSSRTGAIRVNEGSSTLIPIGAYNYCAKYESVGALGLQTFTVAWNL